MPAWRARAPTRFPFAPVRHASAVRNAVIVAAATAFGQDNRTGVARLGHHGRGREAWGYHRPGQSNGKKCLHLFVSFGRRGRVRPGLFDGPPRLDRRFMRDASNLRRLTGIHLLSRDASWRIFGARLPGLQQKMLRSERALKPWLISRIASATFHGWREKYRLRRAVIGRRPGRFGKNDRLARLDHDAGWRPVRAFASRRPPPTGRFSPLLAALLHRGIPFAPAEKSGHLRSGSHHHGTGRGRWTEDRTHAV